MSEHRARIYWALGNRAFGYEDYSRDHEWRFPGGTRVEASAATDFLGSPERVDPEQAFVAALASCHMLTFLALAARKRLAVERYQDEAVGTLEKNADGKLAVTRVVLRPRIAFRGETPSEAVVERLHQQAHEHCFIASSVHTEIVVEAP